ncbi:thiazole biosynthesis adenylyltransferase ThiF [soil metagenome]
MLLPEIGRAGQEALAAAHAMVIGCGALGCPALDLLVRAGVGRVSIVDRDIVETTNLQRQTLFSEDDARHGRPKAEAAAARLRTVNSEIRVEAIVDDFAPESALRLLRAHPAPGVLLDCTDNFETRYLINDAAVATRLPLIYGGAVGWTGMVFAIRPGATACLRCLYPDPPALGSAPTCDTSGIFAPVSALIGALQAAAALKVLAGRADLLPDTLVSVDLLRGGPRSIDLTSARRPDCPCCGESRFDFLNATAATASDETILCGRNAVQISGRGGIDLHDLHARLTRVGAFTLTDSMLRGALHSAGSAHQGNVASPAAAELELTVFADGRAIIKGTSDPARARAIYRQFVGS